jgi:hypothetical protein
MAGEQASGSKKVGMAAATKNLDPAPEWKVKGMKLIPNECSGTAVCRATSGRAARRPRCPI